MDTKTLIDGLVRQTTVLIANVATSAGLRAPLAHVANQIFLDLTGELERQGVGQKVIADMFGLALRSYQQKLRRLSECATDGGQTLWQAVFVYLADQSAVRRAEVLRRFARDDEASVKSILKDLVDSGLIYRTGRGDGTVYRPTPAEDLQTGATTDAESLTALTWLTIHHHGPLDLTALAEQLKLPPAQLQPAVDALFNDGRIRKGTDGQLSALDGAIPLGATSGWETALLDHFQAIVRSMCIKLQNGQTRALPDDEVGGSTYTFDIWSGHPKEAEVKALLRQTRDALGHLWDEVTAHNSKASPHSTLERVTFYVGQSSTPDAPCE